ncbi:MAG: hypothetical protein LBB42_01815 [Coriobacteriales bacterium]|jgi:hypothetical protein|nr:hypothetical protein [Coriobacteriales bacterium]
MRKNRRLTVLVLLIVVMLLISAGLTFAALGSTTSQVSNMFTPSENITAKLSEPNWERAEAVKLAPGKTVKKDPMITNTSEIDEYVALRLTFLYENGTPLSSADLNELLKWIEIDWSDDWLVCDGSLVPMANQPIVFCYKEIVEPGQVTLPLFNTVYVKDKSDMPALTEANLDFLKDLGLFKIKIEGAAVQTESFESRAEATGVLIGLFPA